MNHAVAKSGDHHIRYPGRSMRLWMAIVVVTILAVAHVPSYAVASTPTIVLAPSTAQGGEVVTVEGSGFTKGEKGALTWNGETSAMPNYRSSGRGAFTVRFTVPVGAASGQHTVAAHGNSLTQRATAILSVPSPTPAPTASPTVAPTASPTAAPTASPTPAPAPTASPSPTPTPISSPTLGPTPTVPPQSGLSFVEAQSWWVTTPGKAGTDFGHLHVAAWIPYKQVVSGVLTLKLRFILHDNPGEFAYFNPVLKTDSQEISLPHNESLRGWSCPAGTCAVTTSTTIDTTLSQYDGVQEIRIRAFVDEPDGNRMHASVNALVDIRNGKSVNPIDRKPYQRFKGWYTDSGYCEADILSNLPVTNSVRVQVLHHGAAEDLSVSRYAITVDADAHAGIPGTVVAKGEGELPPTVFDLSGFGPGEHKLAIRAECDDPSGSTNVGVGVTTFTLP